MMVLTLKIMASELLRNYLSIKQGHRQKKFERFWILGGWVPISTRTGSIEGLNPETPS